MSGVDTVLAEHPLQGCGVIFGCIYHTEYPGGHAVGLPALWPVPALSRVKGPWGGARTAGRAPCSLKMGWVREREEEMWARTCNNLNSTGQQRNIQIHACTTQTWLTENMTHQSCEWTQKMTSQTKRFLKKYIQLYCSQTCKHANDGKNRRNCIIRSKKMRRVLKMSSVPKETIFKGQVCSLWNEQN